MQALLNIIGFKVGWLSSVMGAAGDAPWLGPLVFLLVVIFHLRQAQRPELEFGLVLACGIVGLSFDSILVSLGWVAYPSGQLSAMLAPYWIVTMWMLFATTLNRSMSWLKGRPAVAAVLGAIAGPLSYSAGQGLGGIQFVDPLAATIALSIGWAAIMPLLCSLAERLDGFRAETVRESS